MAGAFVGTERRLLATDEISVDDCRCRAGQGHAACDEFPATHELIFVRRGAFRARVGKGEFLMTPAHVLLLPRGTPYRIDHPSGAGDDCTVFGLSDAVVEHVLSVAGGAFDRPAALADTPAFVLQQELYRELSRGSANALAAEEAAWRVVASFEAVESRHWPHVRMSARTRRAVAAAQEAISLRYAESLPLATIASLVGLSRFHLCRYFRAATGTSIHQFQTLLRLREALRRIGEGAADLTALALDLGFADHSHFTAAFQQEFGTAPSRFRHLHAFTPLVQPRKSSRSQQ